MLQNFWIGTDFTKLLSALPVSNEAVKALVDNQLKSLKALEEANQHAIDAFHAAFLRQNEILHAAVRDAAEALTRAPGPALTRQAEISRTAAEDTLENLRRMSEMIAQATEKATRIVNRRIQEHLEEIKGPPAK